MNALDLLLVICMGVSVSVYPAFILLVRNGDLWSPWMIFIMYQLLLILLLKAEEWILLLAFIFGSVFVLYVMITREANASWKTAPQSMLEWFVAIASLVGWLVSFVFLARSVHA